jgi:hypothetical protein
MFLLGTIEIAITFNTTFTLSSSDTYSDPAITALEMLSIFHFLANQLSAILLVFAFVALIRSLHKAGTSSSLTKKATLPLQILAGLLFAAALATFVGFQYDLWHDNEEYSMSVGWYFRRLSAGIWYSLFAAAIGIAILSIWSAKKVRSGLMFTSPQSPVLRGASKRLIVAAILHLLPWLWQITTLSVDLSFVFARGWGWNIIGNVVNLWLRLVVMILIYTIGKWDVREVEKEAVAPITGWTPTDNHVSVQV